MWNAKAVRKAVRNTASLWWKIMRAFGIRPLMKKAVSSANVPKKCLVENAEFHRNPPQKVWAWCNKNDADIMRSASGGAADSAAKTVLQMGGVVYGAAYDELLAVSHIEVTVDAEREKLQSPKYVQSDPKDSYAKAKQRLAEGKTVVLQEYPARLQAGMLFWAVTMRIYIRLT